MLDMLLSIHFYFFHSFLFYFFIWLTGGKHPFTLLYEKYYSHSDMVQSEPHSHTEYVNFEPSLNTKGISTQ